MAINKLPSGNYQVKLRGSDGKWVTKAFPTKQEAKAYESHLRCYKDDGGSVTSTANKITLDEYFRDWFRAIEHQASPGWRRCQWNFYEAYIQPILGQRKLKAITPVMVGEVIKQMVEKGRSGQTQLHVFFLMRKMFRDAIELYQIVQFNPVVRTMKPKVPLIEARHLSLSQLRTLLQHTKDKEYGTAIWLQLYAGLRVGEVVALSWSDVDLERGVITIRRTYSRQDTWVTQKETIKDYPKGRKQHSIRVPLELVEQLKHEKTKAVSPFVVSPEGKILIYDRYRRALRRYCGECGVPKVGTHGLRHSTSELYLHYGATRDDLRRLFAHSSMDITDRYVHERGTNLEKVAKVIQLFPECSMNVPREGVSER
jgi:integrase